ncbi:hypothetical protein SAMN05192558_113191 [Actinokineospora alba]|uniref:DUF3592 domain-containing protein n=1 Tax=Actinokineospora alba TaxID=504798 RepID=A0A1H0VD89_9PSEU|nr:DUF3592 domain-containing protein [Actinokineospora alba]TDP65637.1 hypothetical protein C8E96_1124 [Actinokineospora alba]SDH67218.1 hypothetical protein SAMN05421871_101945 [Actinokineospora alba]SDP76198.1 hypothetical protein SAMN05192558_113191 [Actinokineospora alba]
MEERGAPVRALDGTGPELATPLPAQTPHRPTGADSVNAQLKAPTDPLAAAQADPRGPVAAEMSRDISHTWSAAEAHEVKFEIAELADLAGAAVGSQPAADHVITANPGETRRAQAESEPAESLLGGLVGDGVEPPPADRHGDGEPHGSAETRGDDAEFQSAESYSVGKLGDGAESPPADRPGDGDLPGPADAHRDGIKPQPYKLRRAAACAILFIAVITTLLGVLLVIAAVTEDSAIESHTGRADAEVVDVTTHRTLVRFQTPDGAEHVPNVGVLYPEALEEGQVVRVEYDLREPDLVRVAGRGATLTFLPAFTTLFAVWAVTVGLVWWLRKPGPLHLRSLRARRKLAV